MASEKVKRPQTRGEEIANTVSHGLGAVLAAAGAVPLAVRGILSGSAKAGFSLTAYGISLVLLYTASAVYHAVQNPEVKRRLRIMDHCSIFVLMVGGQTGWMLFLTNTTLAVIGITLNAIDLKRFDKVSLALYALMGWLVAAAMGAVVAALPPAGLALLTAGGVAYTAGIIFYKAKGKYMHFVWHLFVLAGSILQYFCIARYCL